MAFRKLVGSYKDYELSTHIIEDGYLELVNEDGKDQYLQVPLVLQELTHL